MLGTLGNMLNVARDWGVIKDVPVRLKKLKETPPGFRFYDEDQLDDLVLAAEHTGKPNVLLTVLLGGEAGLRCGELRALTWSDLDLEHELLMVSRAMWRGFEGAPKSGRPRTIPLSPRLLSALRDHRHLRGPQVLCTARNTRPSAATIRRWLNQAQTTARIDPTGPHLLRHSFCSMLAMRGTPLKAIQDLAGHQSITTTERYLHLAPGAARTAINTFQRPENWREGRHFGDAPLSVIGLQ